MGRDIKNPKKIILKTSGFTVFPALGPIGIEGYVLICSNEHFKGIDEMPSELDKELENVVDRIKKSVSDYYSSPVVVYEHGGSKPLCYRWGGCLDHFHLHVVPTKVDILGYLKKKDFSLEKIKGFDRLREIIKKRCMSYFLVEQEAKRYVCEIGVLPSQYLRQVIAELEGKKNWDWRRYPGYNVMKKTHSNLKRFLNDS